MLWESPRNTLISSIAADRLDVHRNRTAPYTRLSRSLSAFVRLRFWIISSEDTPRAAAQSELLYVRARATVILFCADGATSNSSQHVQFRHDEKDQHLPSGKCTKQGCIFDLNLISCSSMTARVMISRGVHKHNAMLCIELGQQNYDTAYRGNKS